MKLAAVGDNCMDVYESLNQAYTGGNPVNVAVFFVRLGGEASYTGVVGDDKYGKIMIDAIKNKSVDTSHIRVLHGNTAITKVEIVNGDRILGDYDEGVLSQFKISDEDIDFLSTHDMVVSGLWGMVENDLWKIKAKGTKIAFDFATKLDDPVVEKAIYNVDYAFFSYDEGDDDFIRNYMKDMYSKGPKLVIVTLGEKGSICYNGKDYITHGIVPCEVKDTMGAGDSYIAGFLRGILLNKAIEECMQIGAESAAITLQYSGTWN
ncbi:fructoselysine 6-kinase [Clostridium manihotivorum]|uniref:Fructoselysine 6-kinase n=1 Tax=Clostridium manihotivorum TaxID=2320868 RepID=A0A410DWH5_9CLOT|nr:fructoselysine 6-kinase [Clostridium manihotivorum]QAA33435.1 fructoselysine 6-kinase [Clostridium manihotivorum]